MNSFFKTFFAAFVALIVFLLIVVLSIIIVASVVASSNKPKTGTDAVLVVDLSEHYPEVPLSNPLMALGGEENVPPTLYDMVRIIRHAKTNDAVKGMLVKCSNNDNDLGASAEVRNALLDFKTSKKFIYAYAAAIPQRAYYVASAADKVYCAPTGGIDWHGFSMTLPFIKGTLEKLEIEPQIFYAGKFKSATEPLREKQMTDANRLQLNELLHDIYGRFLAEISDSRKIDTASLHRFADSNAVQFASSAFEKKMVDGLRYDDEVKDELREKLKIDKNEKINFVTASKYRHAEDIEQSGNENIAVIYAEGNIMDGRGDRDRIGGETYRSHIRRARLDKTVKAVVLRVNSGGGSASASEQIWREVVLTRKTKPVIVSFGDVAASGGYYIACGADSIFAQPNTITGSIGVFGILPNMQKFFNNKLGITFDEVSTSPDASVMSITKPLTPNQRQYVQSAIDTIYQQFKARVAAGRKKSADDVENIAQGRIWSGTDAIGVGLVDKLGGIDDAIRSAASMAGVKSYRLKEYPAKQTLLEMLFDDKKEAAKETMVREELGAEGYKTYLTLKNIKQFVGSAQARMPFDIRID
jgi:protease IV